MTRRNLTLVLLVALILVVALLATVLMRRVEGLMREYGVQDYAYDGLQLSLGTVAASELTLRGERGGLLFNARARALELSWGVSELLEGRLKSALMLCTA